MDKILLDRKRPLGLTSESLPLSIYDLQFVIAFSDHFKNDICFLNWHVLYYSKGLLDALLITTMVLFSHFSTSGLKRKCFWPYILHVCLLWKKKINLLHQNYLDYSLLLWINDRLVSFLPKGISMQTYPAFSKVCFFIAINSSRKHSAQDVTKDF